MADRKQKAHQCGDLYQMQGARIWRQVCEMSGMQNMRLSDIFVEVENMELEYRLAFRGN